MICYW